MPLYPTGYGNIGLYPTPDLLTHSADALYYLDKEERKYRGQDGPPFSILHLKHDYDNERCPVYKLPPDTSTQYTVNIPADTSTQPRRFLP